MNSREELAARYRTWPSEDLLHAVTMEPDGYTAEALELMNRELSMRNYSANTRVQELLGVQVDARDAVWEQELDQWLPQASFSTAAAAASKDTMRFLEASLAEDAGSELTFNDVVLQATDIGCGLLLAVDGEPSVAISFGFLATYRMFQDWRSPWGWNGGPLPNGQDVVRRADSVEIAAPNFEYLPEFIRAALRRHLEAAGIHQPRVLLVLWPERLDHRDLAFNVEREAFIPEVYSGLIDSLCWFLPQGYQVLNWESVGHSEMADSAAAVL